MLRASHPLSTFTHSRDFCAVHKNSKNALECQRTEEKERLERGEEPTNAAARTLSSSEAALYEEIASPPPETEDGVSADDAAAAGPPMPMMGGSPGISGVLSRMLPGVPEEDLERTEHGKL